MEKHWIGVLIGAAAIVVIVYLDMLVWTIFGPSSMFQQFPVIYLIVIPLLLIAVSILWGRWPKEE